MIFAYIWILFPHFPVAEHLMAQHSAIKMLHQRVKLILAYIKSIENGTLPANSDILREAYALSQRLPVIQSSTFKEEYYTVKRIQSIRMLSTTTIIKFNYFFFNFAAIKRCRFDHILGNINQRL